MGASVYVVAHKILVSAPVPFWVYWGWNWVGSGWDWARGDLGLKGWGLGLDNIFPDQIKKHYLPNLARTQNGLQLVQNGLLLLGFPSLHASLKSNGLDDL